MRKTRILLGVLSLNLMPAKAWGESSFSLLFTPQEVEMIRAHRENGMTASSLSLSAIMFVSAHNWTIWVNDQMIRAGERMLIPFQIEAVTPHDVTFSWTPDQVEKQTFQLKPGQSFRR